jgi:ribonuclease P protein component
VRSAVQRNRIKRVIRESFRTHQSQLRGLDLVVIARRGVGAVKPRALFSVLEAHWSKLGG